MMKETGLNQKGFTLLEFVMVMLLIAIFSVFVFPRVLVTLQNMRIQAAAERLASDIRYVRELALSVHDVYGVEIDQAGNSYNIYSWDGATKTIVADPYQGGSTLVVDYDTIAEYNGVTISGVAACAGLGCLTSEIRVDAFGIPYDSQDDAFTAPATITLSLGALTRVIRVQPETGFTEIV